MRTLVAASLALLPIAARAQPAPQTMSQPLFVTATLPKMSDGNAAVINLIATGSGLLGPQTANHGLTINCQKGQDWWNNTSTGEVDCLNIVVRQSGPGDSSAIQVNTENLGGGFLAVNESAATSVDKASNKVTHTIDIQEGIVNVGRDVYGFVATNTAGQGTTAFLGQSQNGTAMTSLLQGVNNGGVFYNIDWNGNTTQKGSATIGGLATLGSARVISQLVWPKSGNYTINAGDCGATFRDTTASTHTYTIPKGLPVGCDVHVVQAGAGAVGFAGAGVTVEELAALGSGHVTAGQFAEAELLIDSASTVLLRGQVQ